jgi:hypothetical protein
MTALLLEIVEGAGDGQQFRVDAPVEIGREPGSGIALESDTQVSRRHARLTPEDERAIVEDLGSTNGTFVNDQEVHGPRFVGPGDRIRVGLTVFELRTATQVAARPSAITARPPITAVDNQVLKPVPDDQLAPAGPSPRVQAQLLPSPPVAGPVAAERSAPGTAAPAPFAPAPPAPAPFAPPPLRAQAAPAAYVPPQVAGDPEARADFEAIARLVDSRVKQQRNVALFAMLAAAALAVIIYFGLT